MMGDVPNPLSKVRVRQIQQHTTHGREKIGNWLVVSPGKHTMS